VSRLRIVRNSGEYPTLAAANYVGLQPVTQESVTTYEAGFKATLAERAAQVNAAALYYDYRNKQIRSKLLDPIFGILDTLVNVPKTRIYGAEVNLTIRPMEGLAITGAVTFLDSRVQNYVCVNLLGFPDDFEGDELPFTPKWSTSVNVDCRKELANGGMPFVGVTLNTRSGTDAALGGSRILFPDDEPATKVKEGVTHVYTNNAYATVDARLGCEAEGDAWKVTLCPSSDNLRLFAV
jgi:iron complex outermembrane recepter protein